MEALLHTVFARTTRRAVSSTRMEHNCMNVFVIVKGRCGTGSHFRKLTCLGDIRITTPEQMPAYSYLLPACHSPGHLTSPWRCSSPRPCHTCAGTPETLHTHTGDNTANTYIQTDLSPVAEKMTLPLLEVPALR